MFRQYYFAAFVALVATLLNTQTGLCDWPQFRGVNSSGKAMGDAPIEFSAGVNERWSVEIGKGHSSPCIHGDQIFLTSYDRSPAKLSVVSLDLTSGATNWTYDFEPDQFEKGHPSFNPASSSIACDGKHVVAYFGSYGLACLTTQGKLAWEMRMPTTKSYAGNATSPVIVGQRVILYRGNLVDHFLLAVDKKTGKELWRIPQEEPFALELACTSVPIVHNDQLIVHSARSVQAFDIETGDQIWETKCATTATSTPILAEDQVIIAAWNKMGEPALRPELPDFEKLLLQHDEDRSQTIEKQELPKLMIFHRPEGAEAPQNGASVRFRSVDKDKSGSIDLSEWTQYLKGIEAFRKGYDTHGLLAIPLTSNGRLSAKELRVLEEQGIPEVPSPLYHKGLIYMVKNGGLLTVVDLESGERTSRVRTKGRGTHYASPIIIGNHLYSTAGDGTISVLSLGPTPEVLAVNKMDDLTYATPAYANKTLVVRTHSKVYAFGSD